MGTEAEGQGWRGGGRPGTGGGDGPRGAAEARGSACTPAADGKS